MSDDAQIAAQRVTATSLESKVAVSEIAVQRQLRQRCYLRKYSHSTRHHLEQERAK